MDRLARTIKGEKQKVAFAFLLTMPGAPFIYYGDEIGMRYVEGLTSVEGGFGRTGSRSPMQWDDSLNAGFGSSKPELLYIPLDESDDRPNARAQMEDETSLRSEVKRLIALRQAHKALQSKGEIEFIYAKKQEYPLAYIRSSEEEKLLVVLNPSDKKAAFKAEHVIKETIYSYGEDIHAGNGTVEIGPNSFAVCRL